MDLDLRFKGKNLPLDPDLDPDVLFIGSFYPGDAVVGSLSAQVG
jgi:hypothetical protein